MVKGQTIVVSVKLSLFVYCDCKSPPVFLGYLVYALAYTKPQVAYLTH